MINLIVILNIIGLFGTLINSFNHLISKEIIEKK